MATDIPSGLFDGLHSLKTVTELLGRVRASSTGDLVTFFANFRAPPREAVSLQRDLDVCVGVWFLPEGTVDSIELHAQKAPSVRGGVSSRGGFGRLLCPGGRELGLHDEDEPCGNSTRVTVGSVGQ